MSAIENAVRALAQPSEVQLQLYPDFVCIADELALDFESAMYELSSGNECVDLSDEQKEAISNLDSQLESMSGEKNLHFWTIESLQQSQEWERVRELARIVLLLTGWNSAPPENNQSLYITSP